MRSSFTASLAAAFAFTALVAACCCDTSSRRCDPCPGTKAIPDSGKTRSELRPATVFQRLVVTNKHTKPITVTATGIPPNPTTGSSAPIPFNPPSYVLAPNEEKTFHTDDGFRIDHIDIQYQEVGDPSPYTESVTPIGEPFTRCIVRYDPAPRDTYQIAAQCPP